MSFDPRYAVVGLLLAVFALVPTTAAAAKPLTEKITERVVSTGVDEALEALERPKNQARLGRVLSSTAMRQGMRELAAAMVRGVFDGAVTGAKEHGLDQLGDKLGAKLGKGVDKRVGTITRVVVDAFMQTALSRENATRVETFATHATRGVVAGLAQGVEKDLGPALSRTIDADLGPAVARMIEFQVMPAIARGLDTPEMQEAIATTMRTIIASAVHSGEAAVESEQAESLAAGETSSLSLFGDRVAIGYTVALVAIFGFATALIVLTVLLVRSSRRQRELTEIGRHREHVLMSLLDSVETEHPTLKADLQRLVSDQLQDHEAR